MKATSDYRVNLGGSREESGSQNKMGDSFVPSICGQKAPPTKQNYIYSIFYNYGIILHVSFIIKVLSTSEILIIIIKLLNSSHLKYSLSREEKLPPM